MIDLWNYSRTQAIDKIKDKYRDTYEMVLLTDDQAIEVSDEGWKMVESPRSDLEMEWFTKSDII